MNEGSRENILVVQTSFLGDTVLTLPLLSEVKRRFPKSKVTLLGSLPAQELLSGHPAVDEIIVDDKRKADRGCIGLWRKAKLLHSKEFTLALCPHKSFRSGLLLFLAKIPRRIGFSESKSAFLFHVRVHRSAERHDVERTLSILEGLGIRLEECERTLELPIPPQRGEEVAQQLRSLGVDTSTMLVGLHPGSVWATKRWSAEGFARLIGLLKERYACEILLFGGPEDAECVGHIQKLSGNSGLSLVNRITLRDLPAALSMCSILVSNDSGPMHIAVARGVPVVAIFCATTPGLGFYPYSSQAIVVETNLSCRPCSSHGGRRCPLGTEDCIRLIQPAHVLRAVEQLLDSHKRPSTAVANPYLPQVLTV
jgi:lipopolysaccharide heptosyltransferase II